MRKGERSTIDHDAQPLIIGGPRIDGGIGLKCHVLVADTHEPSSEISKLLDNFDKLIYFIFHILFLSWVGVVLVYSLFISHNGHGSTSIIRSKAENCFRVFFHHVNIYKHNYSWMTNTIVDVLCSFTFSSLLKLWVSLIIESLGWVETLRLENQHYFLVSLDFFPFCVLVEEFIYLFFGVGGGGLGSFKYQPLLWFRQSNLDRVRHEYPSLLKFMSHEPMTPHLYHCISIKSKRNQSVIYFHLSIIYYFLPVTEYWCGSDWLLCNLYLHFCRNIMVSFD